LGLVKGQTLVHPKLVALVDKARGVKKPTKARGRDLQLITEIGQTTLWVNARALHLGEGYVLLLVEDRTESHNLEETRRDFVANISHELKTPIGAISLLAEAIQSAVDDPEQVAHFAASMSTESQRLAELVQDIIQLSRVQSTEVAGQTKTVNLVDVIAEAADRNRVAARKKKIDIDVIAPDALTVFGDEELLKTAVKNLIENAIVSYILPAIHFCILNGILESIFIKCSIGSARRVKLSLRKVSANGLGGTSKDNLTHI
jgi:two-component system sensor histidine kinase SenX3